MNRRSGLAALFLVALLGFSFAVVSYVRYANVWLRKPPKLPPCAMLSRQGLLREELITGSIPRVVEDGSTVYLRKAEERAVRCMDRMSQPAAKRLAATLAEQEPKARARGLVALLRDQVSKDPSADREAIAVYVFTSAAMRALERAELHQEKANEKANEKPEEKANEKQDEKPDEAPTELENEKPNEKANEKPPSELSRELSALRDELDQLNACRFSMRTVCRKRPPMPLVVYAAGAPSSLVLLFGLGLLGHALVVRLRERRQKKQDTKPAAKAPKKNETSETSDVKNDAARDD